MNLSFERPVSDAAGSEGILKTPTHSAAEIGRRVAQLRTALGMSQKDLARAMGMAGPSSIGNIETGDSIKQYVQLAELALILNATPDQLLGFEDLPPADRGDQLDMMGAAVKRILTADGWHPQRAEALVEIATEVALEKSEVDLDRRLEAAYRRRALSKPT